MGRERAKGKCCHLAKARRRNRCRNSSPAIASQVTARHVGAPTCTKVTTAAAASAANWRHVFDIVDRALELPEAERTDYVRRQGAGDAALITRVRRILDDADLAGLLDTPAAALAGPLLHALGESGEPTVTVHVGPYRLLREIGRGGMGTVYLAERADEQFRQRVALKLLHSWGMASARMVRRFLEERQILAALEHPDIARLLDGGVTADGAPWFAMEYVEGQPIDQYCDRQRLTIEDRLTLFTRVCRAVQYAHRNLVVHRDLKPANILITGAGDVKLLDFGIARMLRGESPDDMTARTATGERLMTPLYASPEQLRGDPISTASDVYSLGVLLYELLTGHRPYRPASHQPHEIARSILAEEPHPPSSVVLHPPDADRFGAHASPEQLSSARGLTPSRLSRRLRGDLDTIVLTAMEKEPSARYGSAEQLEAEVFRHLQGHPVLARPATAFHRAHKFVSRHRVGVAAATLVAALVLAFALITTVQSVRIRAQAARITAERDRAERVSTFLAELFRTSDPYGRGGADLRAREILDSGAARIDAELMEQPEARAQMLFEMGRAYHGLGVRPRARRLLESSLALQRSQSADEEVMARTLQTLGAVLLEENEPANAERTYREALDLRRVVLGASHPEVARTLNGLSTVVRMQGRFVEAAALSSEAVRIDRSTIPPGELELAESLTGLALALREQGQMPAARRLNSEAVALLRRRLPEEHPDWGGALIHLAATLEPASSDEADSLFRHAIALRRERLGRDHPMVAADEGEYARFLHHSGRTAEADSIYRQALSVARGRLPAMHPMTASLLLGLGELHLEEGDARGAESLIRAGLAMRQTSLPNGHPHIAEAEVLAASVAAALGRPLEAEAYLLSGLEKFEAAFGRDDDRTRSTMQRLVELYDELGYARQAAAPRARLNGEAP